MRTLVAATALGWILTGCSPVRDSESSDRTVEPLPRYTTIQLEPFREPELVARLDNSDAGDGEPWWLIDVVDDDTLLVQVSAGRRHQAALLDVTSQAIERIGRPFRGAIHAADLDERHLVWVSASSSDYSTFEWELFAMDRRSDRVRKLAEAPRVTDGLAPAAPNGTAPSLHGGRVYLAAVHHLRRNGRRVPAVYSVSVHGGPLRLEVEGAYDVTATQHGLVYARSKWGFVHWSVERRPYDGEPTEVLATGSGHNRLSGKMMTGEGDVVWHESREFPNRDDGKCWTKRLDVGDTAPRVILAGDCEEVWAYSDHGSNYFYSFAHDVDMRGLRPRIYLSEGDELLRFPFPLTLGGVVGRGRTVAWTGVHEGFGKDVLVARLPEPLLDPRVRRRP